MSSKQWADNGWHRVVRGAWLDHGVGVGGNLRSDRHIAARDEERGGAGVPVARGIGVVESRAATRGHHR